jgi:hypothetical protein
VFSERKMTLVLELKRKITRGVRWSDYKQIQVESILTILLLG